MAIDQSTMDSIARHRTGPVDAIARAITAVGTSRLVFLVLVVAGGVWIVRTRRWRLAIACGIAWVGSQVVVALAKAAIDRPRPPAHLAIVHASGSAMPSTAAALTAAVATAFFLAMDWPSARARRGAAWALAAGVGVIGVCVVYLGVHWPSDVLAGWLVGAAVGVGSAAIADPGRARAWFSSTE